MSETSQLVAALKQLLKAKGVTYRDIGRALKLSEASVKRIFAAESFSLERLEEICRSLDLTIYELTRFARAGESGQPSVLSEAQEKSLAQDPLAPYSVLACA
jgi:transcriptional regulator with XRE-family HTH domain